MKRRVPFSKAGKRASADPHVASRSTVDAAPDSGLGSVALDRSRGFWTVIGYAFVLGLVLAFAGLAFLGLVKGGTRLWFTLPKNPDWFSGSLWWVAVTAGAGVLVGVLRRALRLPAKLPGTMKELQDERVEPSTVLKAVVVSLVSLIGGASLGPEDALGKIGGGLGTWVSQRRRLDESTSATNALSGMSGAYAGLLSSPILATSFVVEIGRPKRAGFAHALVAALLCSTVAFAVYFPIAGTTFLGLYRLPAFQYEDWQLAAAVPLGLVAAALALTTVVAIGLLAKITAPLANRTILRSTLGGLGFGLVGVALPLTLFTGTSQLTTVIHNGATLGAGLVIAVLFAKILVFALCEATGFIGGPVLVMLFIGGTAGIAAHLLIPGLPEGLAFATMFAAVPGSLIAAPATVILMVALTTQIGTLQLAPVAIAVLTAYLAVSGSGAVMTLARRRRKPPSVPQAAQGRAGSAS
ncbi:MAG TPA: chloride channel protein [Micromonosporaceae bacterium]|nr:chloride channel protein [Micromonosporaceae bacterium]